ncbi:MAG TPA: TetR/AcrR family transcriptional regulator [Ktedonobacteraceae bacterium]|jgi:AcrR family transcriptional regulator|nr:TetR/AcrR family transcriptional regulator [Ktedonobacteraceae bacterium]
MQETDGQPRLSLREKQRQEREELILQTAEEVLFEKGYYNTSMDEIAARVGIAKGTLYHHFVRKEDLVYALFERLLQESIRSLEQIDEQEGTPSERLHAILDATYQRIYSARFQLFFSLFHGLDLYQIVQSKKGSISDTMERIARRISALLDEGKADGTFDRTIPTPVLVMIFFSMISPKAFKRVVDEHIDPARVVEHISCVFFRGIAAPLSDQDL